MQSVADNYLSKNVCVAYYSIVIISNMLFVELQYYQLF